MIFFVGAGDRGCVVSVLISGTCCCRKMPRELRIPETPGVPLAWPPKPAPIPPELLPLPPKPWPLPAMAVP